jgi:hypothetical protein
VLFAGGQQISFVTGRGSFAQLKKVALTGGLPQTLADLNARTGPPTPSWGEDGNILLNNDGVLASIPSAGGKPTVLLKPDNAKGELYYHSPQLLPRGRGVLVTLTAGQNRSRLIALNPQTGATKTLREGTRSPQFVPGSGSPLAGYIFSYETSSASLRRCLLTRSGSR